MPSIDFKCGSKVRVNAVPDLLRINLDVGSFGGKLVCSDLTRQEALALGEALIEAANQVKLKFRATTRHVRASGVWTQPTPSFTNFEADSFEDAARRRANMLARNTENSLVLIRVLRLDHDEDAQTFLFDQSTNQLTRVP